MKRLILLLTVLLTTLTLSADLVGQIGTWEYGPTEAVAVKDSVAYVSSGSYLWLIDIADEANPSLLQEYKLDNYIYALRIIGNYLYVCKNDSLLLIYNIHNSDSIWLAGEIINTFGHGCNDIELSGDTLFLCIANESAQQYSLNDTINPVFQRYLGYIDGFSVQGNSGAAVLDKSFKTYDLSRSGDLWTSDDNITMAEGLRSVLIRNNYAFIGYGSQGIGVIDISDLSNITVKTSFSTGGYTYDVELIDDSTLAAARGQNGVGIYRIVDDTTFTLLGECQTTGYAFELTLANNRIYAGCRSGGLSIIDISDLSTPTVLGTYDGYSEVRGFDISGDRLYASGGEGGLSIYDITDRSRPLLISKTYSRFIAEDVKVDGNYAYIAEADSGLTIMDISNENAPFIVGSTPISYYARTVDASGDNCACGGIIESPTYPGGISLIDISDKGAPTEEYQMMPTEDMIDFEIRDSLIYCKGNGNPAGVGNFEIWNISNISVPILYDTINMAGNYCSYGMNDTIVFLGRSPKDSVYIYDISDISNITYLITNPLPTLAYKIDVLDEYLAAYCPDSFLIQDYSSVYSPSTIFATTLVSHSTELENDGNICFYASIGSEGTGYLDRGKYGLRIYGINSAGPDAFTIIDPADNDTVSSDSLNILWHSSYSDIGLKRYDVYVNSIKRAETLDTLIELNLGIAGTGRIWIDAIDNLNNTVRSDTVDVNLYSGIDDNQNNIINPLQITGTFRNISIYNPSDKEQAYTITDITGRVIRSGSVKPNNTYTLTPKSGIYYVIDKKTDTAKKMIIIK